MNILDMVRERIALHEIEAVEDAVRDCIVVTALAMLEAGVEKEKIKELMQKHYNLRPSEVDFFIEEAEKSKE